MQVHKRRNKTVGDYDSCNSRINYQAFFGGCQMEERKKLTSGWSWRNEFRSVKKLNSKKEREFFWKKWSGCAKWWWCEVLEQSDCKGISIVLTFINEDMLSSKHISTEMKTARTVAIYFNFFISVQRYHKKNNKVKILNPVKRKKIKNEIITLNICNIFQFSCVN